MAEPLMDTQNLLDTDEENAEAAAANNPALNIKPPPQEDEMPNIQELGGPVPGLWEDVLKQYEEENHEEAEEEEPITGNCCERCTKGCSKCFRDAWAGCTPVDKSLLYMHIIIGFASFGQVVAMAYVKIVSHNQCLLRAIYYPDGTLISGQKFWCDSSLYYGLVSASLVFMFVMVNWTAQLNNNWKWMQTHLALTTVGMLGQIGTAGMFATSYMVWCDVLLNAMHCSPNSRSASECTPERQHIDTCSKALVFFDKQINHERLLQKVKIQSIIAMVVSALVCILWVILLVFVIQKFYAVWFDVKKKREEEEAENARIEEEFRNREPYDPSQGPPNEPHPFDIAVAQRAQRQKEEQERKLAEQAEQEENNENGEGDGLFVEDIRPQAQHDGAANGNVHVADVHA